MKQRTKKTSLAKITRPKVSGVLERMRLFALLDEAATRTVTWLSAPGGSGKSTLVASYLDARGLPCIWYQCDEGDSDPATFFYYMGLAAKQAAPRHKKPLPLLMPEYLAGIPTFTRRYFEALFKRATTIVFDNYQEVPGDSPFQDMIATGFDTVPDGVHIVIISRVEPPPAFARLHANGKIALLGQNDIRFTFGESRELAQGRIPNLDDAYIKALHEKTEGWAAGIILLLERGEFDGTVAESAYDKVFDYFAGEIFNRAEKEVQDFLLKSAFLPALNVTLAEKLTGAGNAGRILSALNRQHFFTERLSGSRQDYCYHPLFRAFLLNRAKSECTPDELAAVQCKAALLLEQSAYIEDAAQLYKEAGDHQGLCRMVMAYSRQLLTQGRRKTLEEWITSIPAELAQDSPWLLYWTGMCSFPLDMPRTREYLEKAFALFRSAHDPAGIYLSWASIVDTYAFGLDEWKPLDDCITIFEDLRKTYPVFPSKEIELIVSSRMLIALTFRNTDQPQRVHRWLERVTGLLHESPSFDIRMDTVFSMSIYYLWKGEYEKNNVLLEQAEAAIRIRKPAPFPVIRAKLMRGIHYWITAQYEAALRTLSEGLELSAKSGVHVFDSLLWCFKAAAEMAPGHTAQAAVSMKNQLSSAAGNTLDTYFYHIYAAWRELLNDNPSSAAGHLEAIAPTVEKIGTPYYHALWNIGMAQTAFLLDRTKDAKTHIHTAHRISLMIRSHVMEWYSLLIEAWFLLREGSKAKGLQALRSGLALGRRYGYVHLEFYLPQVMQLLCAEALEAGIEPKYVKALIGKLGLTPPQPLNPTSLLSMDKERMGGVSYLEDWPYPIKIRTLGRFELIKDDKPHAFTGKVQKKPLEMLMALIALGGNNVPEERLTSALWPDVDGDLAHKSFETTLGRLRLLLGGEDRITYSTRQLTINPRSCWVDSFAVERLFEDMRAAPEDQAALLREKAIGLYKGPFLPSDAGLQCIVSCRETLQNKMLRVLRATGRHYEQSSQWEKAAGCYAKGIETDNLAEEFYQRLMVCYKHLGRHADAVKAYKRCSSLLQSELGIAPSAETEAVYSSIIQKQ